jgi:outer membrane biosynthesis protein TonB
MIDNLRLLVLVFATSLISAASGQTPAPPPANANLSCIERMDIPMYPLLAQQARISGTVVVDVILSEAASVRDVTVRNDPRPSNPATAVLVNAVFNAIRRAVFDHNCGDRTVNLIFVFELAGTSIGHPRQSFAFGSPNKFWIKSEAPHFQP